MITPRIEEEAKLTIKELEDGKLPSEQKGNLITNINVAKEACNGLTQEEKLQAVAENQFWFSCLLARLYNKLERGSGRTWKDTIVECCQIVFNSWKIVVIVGFLATLFALRPEVAQVIASFAK